MGSSTQKVETKYLLVFFLLSLQVALIVLLAPSSIPHDGLTVANLETMLGQAGSWEGGTIPDVATFTSTGEYTALLDSHSAKQTVIFSTCSCDLEQTATRADRAERRGEKVSVVLVTSPPRLTYYAKKFGIQQRLLAMRYADLPSLSGKRTPIEIVTGRDGWYTQFLKNNSYSMKRLAFFVIFGVPSMLLSFGVAGQFEQVTGTQAYVPFALFAATYAVATVLYGWLDSQTIDVKECLFASLLSILVASITCSTIRHNMTLLPFSSLTAPVGIAMGAMFCLLMARQDRAQPPPIQD